LQTSGKATALNQTAGISSSLESTVVELQARLQVVEELLVKLNSRVLVLER
jgi:hypothetical protein